MGYICPQPDPWYCVYQTLCDYCSAKKITEAPPEPLILNGWWSSDHDKAVQWRQTISWAERHGCTHLIPELKEDDKYGGPEGPEGYSHEEAWGLEWTICDAAYHADVDFVKKFIKDGGDVNEIDIDGDGYSPLFKATLNWAEDVRSLPNGDRSEILEVINLLIEAGADLDRDGGSALCHMFNIPEGPDADGKSIISLLIDKGVSIDAEASWGENALTALSGEVGDRMPEFLDYMLSLGANINYQNKDGLTPLMHAVIPVNKTNAKLLLERGADPTITSNNGKSAHDYAVETENDDIVRLFD